MVKMSPSWTNPSDFQNHPWWVDGWIVLQLGVDVGFDAGIECNATALAFWYRLNFFSPGIDFRRQNLTSMDVIF